MAKGYTEALALIEAGKQMALSHRTRPREEKNEKKEHKKPSLEELWVEEHARRERFDAFMKIQKKIVHEDDKKKKLWDVDRIALLLLAIVPMNWAVMYLLLK